MNETALPADLMPVLTIEQASTRYNILVEYTKKLMTAGKDYGVIPGTSKPTLLKPGAEKLCTLFGMAPEFTLIDKITDFNTGLFYFQYRCDLYRQGVIVASGVGSANSKEKKYRYRTVPEWKATQEDKNHVCAVEEKISKSGKPYRMLKVENQEPYDLVNTFDKMAQKRALVAATLIGANASELYTQDVEDMPYIVLDAEDTEAGYDVPQSGYDVPQSGYDVPQSGYDVPEYGDGEPKSSVPERTIKTNFKKRPYTPAVLKEALEKKAASVYPANDKQIQLCAAMLGNEVRDKKMLEGVKTYLFESPHLKEANPQLINAALDWMEIKKDSGGAYFISDLAHQELEAVMAALGNAQGTVQCIPVDITGGKAERDEINEELGFE